MIQSIYLYRLKLTCIFLFLFNIVDAQQDSLYNDLFNKSIEELLH